jgi:hypothetical protein
MSGANKVEEGNVETNVETPQRGRKRKSSVDLSVLPPGIEVVRIEASSPKPAIEDGSSRRSVRGNEAESEQPVKFLSNVDLSMEVEDSILIDGLDSTAETSAMESANVSPTRSPYTGKKRGRKPGSKNKPTPGKPGVKQKGKGREAGQDMQKEKKKKAMSREEELLAMKGPFIHIDGDWNSPNYISIVNNLNDTMKKQIPVDRGAIRTEEVIPRTDLIKHTSTTSRKYDYKNQDRSWVCVFCSQTSHYHGLGDLFGPYYISAGNLKTPQKIRNNSQSSEGSTKKSGSRRRRKSDVLENDPAATEAMPQPNRDSNTVEIWFHEDCFIWIPNVFLIGGRIVGLEEGVAQCQDLFCCSCSERGASVGCTAPGCRLTCHVRCGQRLHWRMDMDSFDAKCVEHLTVEERARVPRTPVARKPAPLPSPSPKQAPKRRISKLASPLTSPSRRAPEVVPPEEEKPEKVTPAKPAKTPRNPPVRNKPPKPEILPETKIVERQPKVIAKPAWAMVVEDSESNSEHPTEIVCTPDLSMPMPPHPEPPPPFVEPPLVRHTPHLPQPPSLSSTPTASAAASPFTPLSLITSPALLAPPVTPKEKPRSHKKKKKQAEVTKTPEGSPAPPAVTASPEKGGAELLSPGTPLSSPTGMLSPGAEREKKVRKRTKFDQETLDFLVR